MKKQILIGELLVRSRIVSEARIQEALALQKKTKMRIGEILIKMGCLTSKTLVQKLCEQTDTDFMELSSQVLDRILVQSFPFEFLYDNRLIPLYETDDNLYVASGDPSNRLIINKLRKFSKKEIVLYGAEPMQILKLLVKA